MTDRELLEAAARAAGIVCSWAHEDEADYSASTEGMWLNGARSPDNSKFWNPLQSDGDALRLAARLGLFFRPEFFHLLSLERFKGQDVDDCTAHRRAIVRAAAELARTGVKNGLD